MAMAPMFPRASTSLRSWLCHTIAPGASTPTNASASFPVIALSNAATSSSVLGIVLPCCGWWWSVSANVETVGAGRHLVQELATTRGVGSTRHPAPVVHQHQPVDSEALVATDGVGVDRTRGRGDRDLERAELGRAVDLARESGELGDSSFGVLEVLEEAVPAVATGNRAAERRGRHAAAEDRWPT